MKNREARSMEEVHKIREELYHETEDMNIHEFMKFIHKEAESFKSKHSLKLKTPKKKLELAGI